MARLSLNATYNNNINAISILEHYRNNSLSLDAKYQYLVAEIVMLRLFSILETAIKETALKLACNTSYRSGSSPTLLFLCRSMADAEHQFQNYNRPRFKRSKWTKASFVNDSIREVIPNTESFYISVNNHSSIINEMRNVRNHIAHRTSSTRTKYKNVIRIVFGANLKIHIGPFLTSSKRLPRAKIDEYIATVKIIINDITQG